VEPLAVDVREAGRLMSLSPRTIRRHIKAGRIRAVLVGRRVLVPVGELRSLIDVRLECELAGDRPENDRPDDPDIIRDSAVP
jgi:excisionase family DNA binding protein